MTRDFLFLLLLASLATACFRNDKDIPEPNYNPHVLKPGKYVPTEGKVVNMDSVAEPEYVPGSRKSLKPLRIITPQENQSTCRRKGKW